MSWKHVALISALLGAIVASNIYAPGVTAALTGVLSTVIAYLTKPPT